MANEAPQFRLSGPQILALTMLEQQSKQMVAAANSILERSGQASASDALMECVHLLERVKLKWLDDTQKAISLAQPSELAERIRAAGFAP